MIVFVRGKLLQATAEALVIDLGGIGLQVYYPSRTLESIPPLGEEVCIHTHLQVKEDGVSLYGFPSREEKNLFCQLIDVTGIGPKGAMGILSTVSASRLVQAVLAEDVAFLTKVPGIGKKTAQRLVLELKDKLVKDTEKISRSGYQQEPVAGAFGDAMAGLMALGYSSAETAGLLQEGLRQLGGGAQPVDLIKFVLSSLGQKTGPTGLS